jgi:hypothetical protein
MQPTSGVGTPSGIEAIVCAARRICAAPEAVWDYACKPENWTASNPTEHFGLHFDSPDNLPHAGVTFT